MSQHSVDDDGGGSLAEVIDQLGESEAKSLLERAARESPAIAAAIRLAVAGPAGRVAILRAESGSVLGTRRQLGYREANAWAAEASDVVDAMEAEAARTPSRELLKLIELSVGRVVKVIMRSDDSSGTMGDVARRLLAIHEQVSLAGVGDPKALARWMIRFGFDDQDFFSIDPVVYAPALGDKGLANYRKAVAERSTQERQSFAVTHAIERLAVLDGDVEAIVALLGQDLTSPHHYTSVAKAMLELRQPDDALQWAERGIAATSGRQVAHLYDIAAGVHEAKGDLVAALGVRLAHHRSMSSASTYGVLGDAARAVGSWDEHRSDAREILGRRDRGSLIDVLLADGDVDAAWDLAVEDGDELGNERLLRLAKSYEDANPAASLDLYVRVVESILEATDRRAYRAAVKQLKNAKRAAETAGLGTQHYAYLVDLRERHCRRPTLVAMLDQLIAD